MLLGLSVILILIGLSILGALALAVLFLIFYILVKIAEWINRIDGEAENHQKEE